MTEALAHVLEAARVLSPDGDAPVWICEEELALVRQGREDADRGDTIDADEFLEALRRGG